VRFPPFDLQHYTSYVGIISHDQYDAGEERRKWMENEREREDDRRTPREGNLTRCIKCTFWLFERGVEKGFITRFLAIVSLENSWLPFCWIDVESIQQNRSQEFSNETIAKNFVMKPFSTNNTNRYRI